MKIKFFAFTLLGIIPASYSQTKIDYVEYDLDNGIHVILHEEHATPIVAVSVLYHVGSKNENPERTGFAHFFEHLLFEGSTNIDRGEYAKLVEQNGGTLNANTSQDRTYYFEILPSNQLELGLWLESERMLHAKVDETGIETQRKVVKEEKRQRVDNQPYGTFFQNIFSNAFSEHPYKWQPIGSMEHLDAAEEADYVNFYRTFYVPANATLSIAGDIDLAQTKEWIDKYFASIPKGEAINMFRDFEILSDGDFNSKYGIAKSEMNETDFMNPKGKDAKKLVTKYANTEIIIPRTKVASDKLDHVITDTIYDNITLPALFMAYRLPEQTHEDYWALQMMSNILSEGSSSRINKSLVERKQISQFAGAFSYALEDAGLGIFYAGASGDSNLKDILAALDEEINLISTELVTELEFEKARNQFENDFVSSLADVAGIAENLADSHVYLGSAEAVNTALSSFLKVTREDILKVAKKYLTNDARVILYYLPKSDQQ